MFPLVGLPLSIVRLRLIAFVGAIGIFAAQALRDAVRKAEQEGVMERYEPEALGTELAHAQDVNRMARHEEVSVLFADIRGFTHLSEPLSPAESVDFLNTYFAAVVAPIAAQQGVIDKYIGDGILVFFEGDGHAGRATRAGTGMLAAVEEFNQMRPGETPLRIGVAVHTGEALIGTVGAPTRMEYTVIGDTVNVAARLEELNKHYDADLILSGPTCAAIGGPQAAVLNSIELYGPDETPIRGRAGALEVYWLAHQETAPVA